MPFWFDGNNLIGLSVARARAEKITKKAFLETLAGYAHPRQRGFLVFFDGDDEGKAMPPRGVQVRYSAPLSADDLIMLRIKDLKTPAEAIVVTNDRKLGARAREAGAKSIDWGEFVARMQRPAARGRAAGQEREEEINLAEWVDFFGLKKDSLG